MTFPMVVQEPLLNHIPKTEDLANDENEGPPFFHWQWKLAPI